MAHDSKDLQDPRNHARELGRRDGKVLMEDTTGKKRVVEIDKEGIKRGDYLQPNEKDAFIQVHGWHPQESNAAVAEYLVKKGLAKKFRGREGQD